MSDGGTPVVPSVMICISMRFSFTLFALRHFVFLTSVSEASCFHEASLNGPLPTKFPASVNLLPYWSRAGLYTGRNDVWDSCWMNQGCGEVSVMRSVHLFSALIPTAFRRAASSQALPFASLPPAQLLYASAPLTPKNW